MLWSMDGVICLLNLQCYIAYDPFNPHFVVLSLIVLGLGNESLLGFQNCQLFLNGGGGGNAAAGDALLGVRP